MSDKNTNSCPKTHTQPFNGLLSGTTRVDRYQKKHSPTHSHPDDLKRVIKQLLGTYSITQVNYYKREN